MTQVTEEVEQIAFIGDLDKAAVLVALFNQAGPVEGDSRYNPDTTLTISQARTLIDSGVSRFTTFNGRILHIDLAEDNLITWAYDQYNGDGAAKAVIDDLRSAIENLSRVIPQLSFA